MKLNLLFLLYLVAAVASCNNPRIEGLECEYDTGSALKKSQSHFLGIDLSHSLDRGLSDVMPFMDTGSQSSIEAKRVQVIRPFVVNRRFFTLDISYDSLGARYVSLTGPFYEWKNGKEAFQSLKALMIQQLGLPTFDTTCIFPTDSIRYPTDEWQKGHRRSRWIIDSDHDKEFIELEWDKQRWVSCRYWRE